MPRKRDILLSLLFGVALGSAVNYGMRLEQLQYEAIERGYAETIEGQWRWKEWNQK